MEAMTTAFRSGFYVDEISGRSFGSGEYGDLGSLVAALLLDRESRTFVLDTDPAHGQVREPFSKVVALMRSLEFQPSEQDPFVTIDNVQEMIGQEPYGYQSVFSLRHARLL